MTKPLLHFSMRHFFPIKEGIKDAAILRDCDAMVGESVVLNGLLIEDARVDHLPICCATITSISEIAIDYDAKKVSINGITLEVQQMKEVFEDTGLSDVNEAFDYYKDTYGTPFQGVLVRWE